MLILISAAISSPSAPMHSNDSCASANHAWDLKCSNTLGHPPKYLHDFHYKALINHDSSVSNSKNLSNLRFLRLKNPQISQIN